MKNFYNKAKALIKANLFSLTITIAVACIGGFCFFYFSAKNNQSDWLASFYSPDVSYIVSQGNAINFIEWSFRPLGLEGAKTFSLVLTYLCLLVVFLFGQTWLLLKAKGQSRLSVLLFTVSSALLLFNPMNGINRVGSAYLFSSALVCFFALLLFAKAKRSSNVPLICLAGVFGVVLNGFFASTFSIILILLCGVIWVFSWIKKKKVSLFEALYFGTCLIACVLHYLPYFAYGNGLGALHHPSSFGEFAKALVYAFAPNALGSFTTWNVTNSLYSSLGTIVHAIGFLWGLVTLALIVFVLVRALYRKRFASSSLYMVLVFLLLFACIHISLSSFNQFVIWDAATSLVSLPVLVLLVVEFKRYPLLPNFHFSSPLVAPALKEIGLVLLIVGCSLGGFSPAAYNAPSFEGTNDFYQMVIAALPSEIPLDSQGYSAIGGSKESSYAYASNLRKNGEGVFSSAPITASFYSSSFYYGTNGRVFEDGNFDGWVDSSFRVLLKAGSNGILKFDWFLVEDQLGGTMKIFADGTEVQSLVCKEQKNSLQIDGFNPNENYFIACRYDKPFVETEDVRDLSFLLVDLTFEEAAL